MSSPSQHAPAQDVFGAPEQAWVRLSPKLMLARRIVLLLWMIVPVGVVVLLAVIPDVPRAVPMGLGAASLVFVVWAWWFVGRRVRSYGYLERDDDLLVTSGIMFRRLVVVPYGRMQLVDVVAGPIDRLLGIATVQLHTAAATTDAAVPGLPPEAAAGLRDRLAARGEQRSAGL